MEGFSESAGFGLEEGAGLRIAVEKEEFNGAGGRLGGGHGGPVETD